MRSSPPAIDIGELINFSAEIRHLEVHVTKNVVYQASSPSYKTKYTGYRIFEYNVGEMLVNDKRDYAYSFKIPPTVSSSANPSFRVIQISYVLSIKAKVLIKFIDLYRLFD
jgi:hypothetical protein